MPTSLTPAAQPADDETEYGNCGGYEQALDLPAKCDQSLGARKPITETDKVSAFDSTQYRINYSTGLLISTCNFF